MSVCVCVCVWGEALRVWHLKMDSAEKGLTKSSMLRVQCSRLGMSEALFPPLWPEPLALKLDTEDWAQTLR